MLNNTKRKYDALHRSRQSLSIKIQSDVNAIARSYHLRDFVLNPENGMRHKHEQ